MVNQEQIKNFRFATLTEIKAVTNGRDGICCYCDATLTLYEYITSGGSYTANDQDVLITGAGGNTRWLGIAGQYNHFGSSIGPTPTFQDVTISNLNRNFVTLGTDTKLDTGIPVGERQKFKIAVSDRKSVV
jgi:hypothetical protein